MRRLVLTVWCLLTLLGVGAWAFPLHHLLEHHTAISECASRVSLDVPGYALSGAISGGSRAVARFISYPLDTLKTIKQAESLEQIALQQREKPRDVTTLFRGVSLAVVSAVPANALFIVVFNSLDAYLPCLSSQDDASLRLLQRIIISSIATVPQNLFKVPAELLKQRAQLADEGALSSMLQDIKRLGVKGLYQGGGAMMLREIPFNAIQMATFYYLKEASLLSTQQEWIKSLNLDPVQYSGALGLLAAFFSALLTQPADTVKTKMMKVTSEGETIMSTSVKIWQQRGWQGFYVGLYSRLALVSIGGLVYFASAALVSDALK